MEKIEEYAIPAGKDRNDHFKSLLKIADDNPCLQHNKTVSLTELSTNSNRRLKIKLHCPCCINHLNLINAMLHGIKD